MINLRTLTEISDFQGKTFIVRSDLDVEIENGNIVEDFRIRKAVATIKYLIDRKAKVVIMAHLGRPGGKYVDDMSLMPVRFELGKLLNLHIKFAHIPNSRNSIKFMEDGEVLMLENVRFHPEEESDDVEVRRAFVAPIAELGDYFVNDAFASYRPQASTYDIAKMFEAPLAGLQLKAEIDMLSQLKDSPESPYVAVIGGVKLDTKIPILQKLTTQADYILIGGAMAYTFLKAQGVEVGDSKVEDDKLDIAKQILADAKGKKCQILLPIDHVVGSAFAADTKPEHIDSQTIPAGKIGLDVGPKTLATYEEIIKNAKSILWNGPMGVFEWDAFSVGTDKMGEIIGLTTPASAFKVAGGGDTITAMNRLKINMKNWDHVSTGGGAMLAFLSGEEMPTLEPLTLN